MNTTRFHFLWQDSDGPQRFTTAVSLHSHTMHSCESLVSVAHHIRRVPLLSRCVQRYERSYQQRTGHAMDYARVHWTPPLHARGAFELERNQIEQTLGLRALVSLTDHDEIEANMQLQVIGHADQVPISLEWTVPFGPSFFHLGVHNLPGRAAHDWLARLSLYTRQADSTALAGLLSELNNRPDMLIVLNHPLWDEPGLGAAAHGDTLGEFLSRFGHWIHALEVNGQRTWSENRAVVSMARDLDYPVISGGDRHGSEPNAIVNLTDASSFGEFVNEIRQERRSEVLFMPQYRESHRLRMLECTWDIVREYPELPGRERWSDRAFYRGSDGQTRSLASYWGTDAPGLLRCALSAVRLSQYRALRPALRMAFARPGEMAW